MQATKLLKDQHEEVKELFEKYEKATEESEKRKLFVKIADDLSAHTTIEEKIFYPAIYIGPMKDMLLEAVEEHLSAKRVIADLLDMKPSDENFDAKVKVLKELVEHHIEEEEEEMFEKVDKNFSKEELEAMGTQMEAMFNELQESEPRMQVPAETAEAAPLE